MRYYPITLGVVRPNWGKSNAANQIKGVATPEMLDKIFKRHDYTCQCCGFRSEKYQKVLHLNGDSRDFREDNVLTACIFCHQCFDLHEAGDMESGMLIWLPEISQAHLHHVMRAIYLGRVAQGGLGAASRDVYNALIQRGEETRRRLGSTDPKALAIIMRDFLTHKQYANAQGQMEGIRLLPLDRRMVKDEEGRDYNEFPQMLAYWRAKTGPFNVLPVQKWAELFSPLPNL